MKKKFLAMALGIAVVLSCTACGGGSSDTAAPASGETNAASSEAGSDSAAGGSTTVTVAIGAGFSTLDPGYVYEKYPPLVINACYENLIKFYIKAKLTILYNIKVYFFIFHYLLFLSINI